MNVSRARVPRHVATLIAVVLGVGVATPLPARESLPDRMAAYAVRFGRELQGVVATERYVQVIRVWPGFAPKTPAEPPTFVQARRALESELLLVYDAEGPWQLHRDVRKVDGQPVGDRESRLRALFLEPGVAAHERLGQIFRDSARYNLGDVTRTLNIPTFPLIVVHPEHRDRFRLRVRGVRQQQGVTIREVTFEERRGGPTLVRSTSGDNVPLRGRLLVDDETGEFIHAQLNPRLDGLTSRVEVWFDRVAGLPVRVPVRMWDWYFVEERLPAQRSFIEGVATYDDFRRYGVETEERLGPRRR